MGQHEEKGTGRMRDGTVRKTEREKGLRGDKGTGGKKYLGWPPFQGRVGNGVRDEQDGMQGPREGWGTEGSDE